MDKQPRMMPYNLEAEQSVLGSILIDPNCFADLTEIIHADDFYLDEHGERKRKAFSGKTKKAVQDKLNEYVADFHEQVKASSDKCNQKLRDGMMEWLKISSVSALELIS